LKEEANSKWTFEEEAEMTKRKDLPVPAGYSQGQAVIATKDLKAKGLVIVKQATAGKVLGASLKTPETRITVVFAKREDGTEGYLNVLPKEIEAVK